MTKLAEQIQTPSIDFSLEWKSYGMASAAVYFEQLDFNVDFLRNLCLFQIRKTDTELAALCFSD